jgi:hypothetical protein
MTDDNARANDDRTTTTLSSGRRDYLKLTGTAAISAVGVSLATGQAAGTDDSGVKFEKTVNMVEDAGCDPTAGESCREEIMEYAADDTLLLFPEGTYFLDTDDDTHVVLEGYDSLGLAGVNENVTFKFASGTDGYNDIEASDIGQFVYKNLDWDITAENCAPGFAVRARDRLHIEKWAVNGRQDNSGGFTLQPSVANADGIGIIEQFVAKDGCKLASTERAGVLVSQGRNNGTLRFIDCQLEEFSNNGLYAAASSGPIQVEGGVFRNCGRSQLRFSGEGSYIDGALVEVDLSKIPSAGEPDGLVNGRGIWWETKNTDPLRTGGEIRNTEVIIRNGSASPQRPVEPTVPNTTGGIVVRANGGACTIKDSRIQMDVTPRVAVYAKAPVGNPDTNKPAPPKPHRIVMENVTITGSASDWAAVQIEERPDSVINDCDLDVGYRDGIVLAECDGATVRDTVINSKYGGGRPIVLWGTEAEISDITTNNANPIPDGGDNSEEDENENEDED